MKKHIFSLMALLVWGMQAFAQTANSGSMLRASGKIYVVVGIIAIIFIFIVLYLFRLDKKLSRLEKQA
jgi:CcmD family protein